MVHYYSEHLTTSHLQYFIIILSRFVYKPFNIMFTRKYLPYSIANINIILRIKMSKSCRWLNGITHHYYILYF